MHASTMQDSNASEPESIRVWKEEYQNQLKAKDEQSEQDLQKLKAGAKKELEEWRNNLIKNREEKLKNNKDEEQEFIRQRDNSEPGSEWELVAFHLDFDTKKNYNTKDTSRMRKILLQLKQHGLKKRA